MADDIEESKLSAEDRAKRRRARQTMNNLLLSLLACGGLVLALVLIVPRDDSPRHLPADYVAIATDAAVSSKLPILAPDLIDSTWYSSAARWNSRPADGVANWYVGFVGEKGQYLGLTQAFNSNPTWLTLFLQESIIAGTTEVDGISWTIYESVIKNNPPKSRDYAMVADVGSDQVIIYGTASDSEFESFALNVSKAINSTYSR